MSKELKLSQVLNKIIKERYFTYNRLAKEAGIPQSTLFSWTTGVMPKDINKVSQLADFLGLELHYLLYGEHDPKNKAPLPIVEDYRSIKVTAELMVSEKDLEKLYLKK